MTTISRPYRIVAFLGAGILPSAVRALATCTEIKLQSPHPIATPQETLQALAEQCEELGIADWDIYGDFDKSDSYLRRFEAELAQEFQKEDAVFVPSGVMAQSIALMIYSKQKRKESFVCHATSHLLLHEQSSFRELCNLEAISLGGSGLGQPALQFEDIRKCLETNNEISTILLELPHRELGGKLTPWTDVVKMQQLAKTKGVAFHCDGARVFEATVGYDKSLAELAEPFDSIYISFYKGLGGISGAMLLGSKDFCDAARIWLRRFGGNLYTLLPYAVSGWSGYRRHWVVPKEQLEPTDRRLPTSFRDKKNKLTKLANAFSSNEVLSQVLTLEPSIPLVNMVHVYLRSTAMRSEIIRDRIQKETGVVIFHRIRPINESDPAFNEGYRCKFELSIGEANGSIHDEVWIQAWDEFGRAATRDQ